MRRIFHAIFFCLFFGGLVTAQETSTPSEIAVQRIQEAQASAATFLDLSSLGLSEVPPEIANLSKLQILLLGGNQFTSFPTSIASLDNLQNLDLSHNDLSSLSPEIDNLINLQQLHLSANELTSLPAEIGTLSNLISLTLDYNQLSSLPPEIGNLSNLISLYLNNNQLSSLPPGFNNLSNLCTLDLAHNRFQALPLLGQLDKLDDANCHLYVMGNPIVTPVIPVSVATQVPALAAPTLIEQVSQTPMSIIVTVSVIITATPEILVNPTTPVQSEAMTANPVQDFDRIILAGAAFLGILVALFLGLRLQRDTRKRKPKQS
jgi:hypothetical protein